MAVYADRVSPYFELAEEIAADRGEEVVSDFQYVNEGPVFYVASPDEIREGVVVDLVSRLVERGPEDGAFGIITGHTVESARDLYYRDQRTDGDHCVFSNLADLDWDSADENVQIYSGPGATAENLERSMADGLTSLSVFTEGRSMHLKITDGFVCGFPSLDVDFDGRQPYCVADGEMDCPYDGSLIRADEVDASHVFVNSCVSVLPGNDYESIPVHVGLGLLERATTLVGTFRPGYALPQECLLNQALLRDGYTAAERCRVLNKNAKALSMEAIPYELFGRPGHSLGDGKRRGFEVDVEIEGRTADLEFRNVEANVLDVRIPDFGQFAVDDRFFLRTGLESSPDDPIFYSAFPDDGDARILVYSYETLSYDSLPVQVSPDPDWIRRQRDATAKLDNLRALRKLGIVDSDVDEYLQDLANDARTLPSAVEEATYDADAFRHVAERNQKLDATLEKCEEQLISTLEGRYLPLLHSDYDDSVVYRQAEKTHLRCPYCQRETFGSTGESIDGGHARTQCTCAMCGFIFDQPGDVAALTPYPQIEGDLLNVDQGPVDFEISYRNDGDEPATVTFLPWLGTEFDEYRGTDFFDRKTRTKTIPPNEVGRAEFTIDFSSFTPNEYMIAAFVLDEMDVHQGIRKTIVGESMGHVMGSRL